MLASVSRECCPQALLAPQITYEHNGHATVI